MRAALVEEFGPPEVLRIVGRPVPEPGPHELSVDVAFAGVGLVDVLMRRGDFPLTSALNG